MDFLRQFWTKKNYRIASIIAVAIGLWLLSGQWSGEEAEGASPATETAMPAGTGAEEVPGMAVRARYITAQPYQQVIKVAARTAANRRVDVRAEVDGLVTGLPAAKGSRVAAGDVLCELAEEDRRLRVAEAEALVARAQLEYDGSLQLKTGGFQSRTAIAASKAALETARADLKRRQLELEKTTIRAPFDGYLDGLPVEQGDFIRRGDHCATVLELDPLLVTAQVSASEVAGIQTGQRADILIAGRERRDGSVRFVRREADAATRTFLVEVAIANPEYRFASGLTAEMILPVGAVEAHLIPPSLLALDDQGDVGVRILDADNRVQFVNVAMVGDQAEGIWVQGLPRRTLLITVGQEYVSPGQQVAVTLENAAPADAASL